MLRTIWASILLISKDRAKIVKILTWDHALISSNLEPYHPYRPDDPFIWNPAPYPLYPEMFLVRRLISSVLDIGNLICRKNLNIEIRAKHP